MPLVVNRIEVLPAGTVQVRHIDTDTGEFHREVLAPGDTARAEEIGGLVPAVCAAAWS